MHRVEVDQRVVEGLFLFRGFLLGSGVIDALLYATDVEALAGRTLIDIFNADAFGAVPHFTESRAGRNLVLLVLALFTFDELQLLFKSLVILGLSHLECGSTEKCQIK